jgi:hypothetical protein
MKHAVGGVSELGYANFRELRTYEVRGILLLALG